MFRLPLIAALVLAAAPASALDPSAKNGIKLGVDCVGPVSTVAPRLGTCAIAGAKTRIWCPNGDVFDRAEDRTQVALIRSLCNLAQIP